MRLFTGFDVVRADLACATPMTAASDAGVAANVALSFGPSSPPAVVTADSPISLTAHFADGSSVTRRYPGSLRIAPSGASVVAVNTVPLETYVPPVMASEISAGWLPETLAAQAIAVRTYAVRRAVSRGAAAYDLADDTSNQVYRGLDGVAPSLADAAAATAGRILTFGGKPADVWYHAACGGHTAAAVEITGLPGPSYLAGVVDLDPAGRAYCASSPYWSWRNRLDGAALARALDAPGPLVSLAVAQLWPDGRVHTVTAGFADGSSRDLDGHAFYRRIAAKLGYKVVPSALFTIAGPDGGAFTFTGRGVGHGVGMCQWGAQGRARAGMTASLILQAYFPGTVLGHATSAR